MNVATLLALAYARQAAGLPGADLAAHVSAVCAELPIAAAKLRAEGEELGRSPEERVADAAVRAASLAEARSKERGQ